MKKKPIFVLGAVLLMIIFCFMSYWAYFEMRYDIIYWHGTPVRYDTWNNDFTTIRHQQPVSVTAPEEAAIQAPAPEAVPFRSKRSLRKTNENTMAPISGHWEVPSTEEKDDTASADDANQAPEPEP